MVYADRLSGFPFVKEWRKDPNASEVLKEVRRYFVDMGVPVQMCTDGGPQFAAKEFRDFLKKWGVDPALSTPHYPQSNGHAESSVRAMKNLVIKTS
jgi:transposase InsO family protein